MTLLENNSVSTRKPQILKGFRDYTPEQMRLRLRVISIFRTVFERHGFEPLDTPALEYMETLTGKAGENEKLMYHFLDQGDREVGLRYDLTVPLARMAAMHQNELVLPFKRYHIAPVWRAEKPQRGRFREFWQCDADIVGSPSMLADAEAVSVLTDALEAVNLGQAVVSINHRKLLEALARLAGVPEAHTTTVFRAIDKLGKIGPDGVKRELTGSGVDDLAADRVVELVTRTGSNAELLAAAESDLVAFPGGVKAVSELRQLAGFIDDLGVPSTSWKIDLSLARGIDYYTGPVFEALVEEPRIGAGHGADPGLFNQRLEHRPGVVVDPASEREVDFPRRGRDAQIVDEPCKLPQFGYGLHPTRKRDEVGLGGGEQFRVRSRAGDEYNHAIGGQIVNSGTGEFSLDPVGANLAQLVDGAEHRSGVRFGHPGEAGQRLQQLPVIDRDHRLPQIHGFQRVGEDAHGFGIRQHRGRTDDVCIALPEFPEPAPLRFLGPPHRSDLVALERDHRLLLVHRVVAGQRDSQVVAKTHLPIALIEEVIHQLFVLAGLAGQGLHVLKGRCVKWFESVPFEDRAEDRDHAQAEAHLFRRVVPEAFEDLRFACTHAVVLRYSKIVTCLTHGSAAQTFSLRQSNC